MAKALLEVRPLTDQELPLYVLQFMRKTRVLGYRAIRDILDQNALSWLVLKVNSPLGKLDIAFRYDPLQFDPQIAEDFKELLVLSIAGFAYEHAIPTATMAQ
jgi:hypothetical protein